MLYTWGWGEKGQLGGGTTDDIFVPQELDLSTILIEGEFPTSVSAGGYATSFITTSMFYWLNIELSNSRFGETLCFWLGRIRHAR